MNNFQELGINQETIKRLSIDGIDTPTIIQKKMIPTILEGKDVIARARTGTGKTLGFLLPAVERLKNDVNRVKILVITPTRELALQITEEVRKLIPSKELAVAVYGGQDINVQIEGLKSAAIMIGTPGRLLDHLRRGTIDLKSVTLCTIDEGDQLLHIGFLPDVAVLLEAMPQARQTILCSATMPEPVKHLSKKFLTEPVECSEDSSVIIPDIKQTFIMTKGRLKQETLFKFLHQFRPYKAILFCRTKRRVDRLAEALKLKGYESGIFHGNLSQAKREQVVEDFRQGDIRFLVATDIAARGLDIEHVTHVVNYDMPLDVESYVHRIGRTARAGEQGLAVTLVIPSDEDMVRSIEESLDTKLKMKRL